MKKLLIILIFIGFTQTVSFAQLTTTSSFGFRYIVPTDVTADAYDSGWGLIGTSNIEILPILDITIAGTWSTLKGKEIKIDDHGNVFVADDLNILGFTAGPVLKLGLIDFGVKAGYYFDDIHEWVILPFAEIELWKISLGAEYKAFDKVKWLSAYLSYNF